MTPTRPGSGTYYSPLPALDPQRQYAAAPAASPHAAQPTFAATAASVETANASDRELEATAILGLTKLREKRREAAKANLKHPKQQTHQNKRKIQQELHPYQKSPHQFSQHQPRTQSCQE